MEALFGVTASVGIMSQSEKATTTVIVQPVESLSIRSPGGAFLTALWQIAFEILQAIREAVVKEIPVNEAVACGFAGGASGGDILFQEVCAELSIPTQLYLAIPPERYVVSSVQQAGERWVERFWKLYHKHSEQKRVCVLSEATDVLDEREYLPAWLRTKPDYGIWQRNNLWTLFNAMTTGGACNLTLIALWDGESTGDGPGGTSDLVRKVQECGARAVILNTKELFGL